ncbi:MAG: chain length determinant protein EpsF [Burkholderiaceae bacterium]|nr:chain length determinant protein EpsF [Burkholderiaceae bacterium]
MSFANFIAIVRARWWLLLLVLVATVGTAVIVSFQLPKKYLATASVVVDAKPDPISALIYPGMGTPAIMATQVDVLISDRVAFRVVRDLKLAESKDVREQWRSETEGKGTIEQWLSASLQKNLDVKPSRDSNVISVSYLAPDPEFAAALANAFVQAYIATNLELRVDPAKQFNTFFDDRAKAARVTLEAAQTKLSAFQRQNGIVVNDERVDVEMSRLNELSSQLVALQAVSAESTSRQAQAAGASADRLQEVLLNPVIGQLKSDLNRSETRLQELQTRYGENHPQVIEAKANIAQVRSRVEAETRRVSGGAAVSSAINRQREAEIRAALEAQRAKVLRLKSTRDEGSVLMRDLESAQRAFEGVSARLTQSGLESQTTQSNVNMLTQAVPPLNPSSPRIAINTALSIVVGLLLGLGIVVLLELRDRRVRSNLDVVNALGLPLLGVIPKPGSRRSGVRRSLAMKQRVLGMSVARGKGAA